MDFCCPVCALPLTVGENLIKRCSSGHSFDRARAGYYNLLSRSGAGTHGDNREMVEARRAFLSAGHYAPLADRLVATVMDLTPRAGVLVDLGAGEGYYTDKVERALWDRDGASSVLALDISKDAMKHLARRNPRINAAVASSYSAPISDGCVEVAIAVFAPLARDEILRILKPRGKFVMVFPDEMHLFGLKSAIYKTPYKNKPEPTDLDGFRLLSDEVVSYELELNNREDVRSLFMMTPYAYRTSAEDRDRILSRDSLRTEVAFRIVSYEKID